MAWQIKNEMPNKTVKNKPITSCLRFFFNKPQCAHVTVAPDVKSKSVLIAGNPHAPIGVNLAATYSLPNTTPPGPADGQASVNPLYIVNSGSNDANSGIAMILMKNKAPKNAAKKATSEPMNVIMPMRNDLSSHFE